MSDSMNVRNCRKCGRIFNYVVGPILCPRCVEEQEKVFQVVKEYVIEHHGADIAEVSLHIVAAFHILSMHAVFLPG